MHVPGLTPMAEDSSGGGGAPPVLGGVSKRLAATETLIGELAAEPDLDIDVKHGGESDDEDDESWDDIFKKDDEEVQKVVDSLARIMNFKDPKVVEPLLERNGHMLYLATVSGQNGSVCV